MAIHSQELKPSKKVNQIRNKKFSICLAINCDGNKFFKIKLGSYNGNLFKEFLCEFFDWLDIKQLKNCCIIMDNATIHKTVEVLELIRKSGNNVLFLPPYSPALNPIENVFRKWKAYVRSQECNNEE